MPAPRIRADYEQLRRIASLFGRESQQAAQMLRRVKNQVETLRAGEWVGKGANDFYREMSNDVLPSLTRLAKALEQAQRTTDMINRIMKNAEEEAARLLGAEGGGGAAAGAGSGDGRGAGTGPGGGPDGGGGGAEGASGLPDWLSNTINALGLTSSSLTGLGELAARVAGYAESARASSWDDMARVFALGGEDALRATGLHETVARWTTNSARASRLSEFLGNKWFDRLGKAAAVGTGVEQAFTSSAETLPGKLVSGGGAGALAWASRNNPYLAAADLGFTAVGLENDRPSAIVGNSVDNIVVLGEGLTTGSTRGMESIHSRNLSGENGWVFQQAAQAGDFWAENGISGGMSQFWTEVKGLF